MKKFFFLATLVLGSFTATKAIAQTENNNTPEFPKMDVSPMDMAHAVDQNKQPLARVIYGRPQKRGREIFGNLEPFGEVWRTGANEATEITFFQDMELNGERIEKGAYTLYTIPERDQWTIILNEKTNTWGAYDYDQEKDVVRHEVPAKKLQSPLETLSMAFEPTEDGTTLSIGWDDTYVQVPFTYPEEE